jgi:purine-nucleoside phosphorylase
MSVDPEQQVEAVRIASDWIRGQTTFGPRAGLILGTGLGRLAETIDAEAVLEYAAIPGFPLSTVESHHGRLIFGDLEGLPIVAMQGRLHLYEGYDARQITFPVRVMAALGIETLLISNAAGGMNPEFRRSDLMLISDHINLQGVNPLEGPNVDAWGPRFPDMSEAYDAGMRHLAANVADECGIELQEGVYVAVTGPNLETRAEYAFLRGIGGDAVGMSTVPEVIVARHMGLPCLGISVITDECVPETLQPVSIEDVLAAAAAAEPNLIRLMQGIARRMAVRTNAEV